MQFLTVENVIRFYTEVIGPPVRRSPDGLASAVGRPQQSVFGQDAYPSLSLKAAALMQSLAENQPFVDGNKRVAWICGKVFLELHGLTLQATDAEALELFINGIAKGMTVAELAAWIDRHLSAMSIPDDDSAQSPGWALTVDHR